MPRKIAGWIWSHRWLSGCLFLALTFVLFNAVAYNHARAMTHFAQAGARTENPDTLSRWQKLHVLLTGVNLPRPRNDTTPAVLIGLPFETHTFPREEGSDIEAWYVPHANSKALVLLFHGYAASKATMLRQAQVFHELGYSTFLVDFRGSGGSSGNVTTIGMCEADDVARAVEYVRKTGLGRPIFLYGVSMGSAAILRAIAVNGVRPEAVVLECPFDRLISTVENRFTAMGLPTFPFAQALVFWGGVQHGFNGFVHNPVEYARGVRCPVLLMHGEKDPRVNSEQAESIFQNLAGKKEFVVFPGLGHESYLDAQPEVWKQKVKQFLSKKSD